MKHDTHNLQLDRLAIELDGADFLPERGSGCRGVDRRRYMGHGTQTKKQERARIVTPRHGGMACGRQRTRNQDRGLIQSQTPLVRPAEAAIATAAYYFFLFHEIQEKITTMGPKLTKSTPIVEM